ncbi:RrF2 family transcriptional regulator [Poriferisphaera sp. WC338]|uniref:RrF2 family transcriptional regulator n=1 Tax=Poriferisphaera sp. WC338 TaxID=3425129 RepID=UPI003D8126DA
MKLSKTSAHAALAIAFLAGRTNSGPTQARAVAEHLGIPTDSALKILQALSRHRLIKSQLGRSGGYILQRPADSISLLEIVEAIDGPIAGEMPISQHPHSLDHSMNILHRACQNAADQLRESLERYNVADLIYIEQPPNLAAAG